VSDGLSGYRVVIAVNLLAIELKHHFDTIVRITTDLSVDKLGIQPNFQVIS